MRRDRYGFSAVLLLSGLDPPMLSGRDCDRRPVAPTTMDVLDSPSSDCAAGGGGGTAQTESASCKFLLPRSRSSP
jgi:hypothetical protein